MTSKGSVNKKESKGNNSKSGKSHRSNEVNSTADKFGIWSTVTRVFLAFLVVVILILLIVWLIHCMSGKDPHCTVFAWLITFMCMGILIYGLWGIYAEAFWSIASLALNLFVWAIFILIDGWVVEGLLGLFTAFISCIYAYMIWKSGLPLNGAAGCCCCICIC